MAGWGWLGRRLEIVFRKRRAENELEEEIRFHLEMETRKHVEAGMEPGEARRRALVDFGGVERHKEEVRNVRGARLLDDWIQDSRVALRSLPQQPAFLLAVLLTLGIAIGGNVGMFGVLERTVFRALPYAEPDRLVLGRVTFEGEVGFTVSGPDFFDYREEAAAFEHLAALTPFPVFGTLTGGGEPERVLAPVASVGFFETFGASPALGRFFAPEEEVAGGPAAVVLSHGYWQRRYAGDRTIVGRRITLDGAPYSVVGVAPPGFRFLMDADLWRPIQRDAGWASARQFHNFVLVGRLAGGSSREAAQAEVDAISARLEARYPDTNRDKGLRVTALREALSERYRSTLNVLVAAVAVLLLIACANVAGLLLARGGARRSELAVRSVMGAGTGRLARQLLTENVHLAAGAGVMGLLMAVWVQRGILTFLPMDRLGRFEAGLSLPTLGFAAALSLLTVVLFGVAPALRVARTDPAGDLRTGGRGRGGDAAARFRSGLVVAQVALTAVLLVVSGLLFRSFQGLTRVDSGFESAALLTADVSIPGGRYTDRASRVLFFTQLTQRIRAVPGVSAVAVTTHLPIQDPGGNVRVARPEEFGAGGVFGTLAYRRGILPGYFETLGIPLVSGRDVQASDDADAPAVVVVSADLAQRLFGEEDPLGRAVAVDQGGSEPGLREVVGVVGDVVSSSLEEGPDLTMYYPYPQSPSTRMRLAVRGRGDLAGVAGGIRGVLRELDPDVPLHDLTTMEEAIRRSVSDERIIAAVLTTFAGIALLLAAVGLYGVLAYQVSRRLHEIGVRLALGASVSGVTRGIVGGGLRLVALGLVLGIPGAVAAGRVVRGMLFGVEPADPLTLAAVAGFVVVVGVTACLLPARRAARVDPVEAFRSE